MRLILIFAFKAVLFSAYGLDSGLRVSLEYFKILYTNDEYIELDVVAVTVNNRTKKLRGHGLIRYKPTDNLEIAVAVYKPIKNKEYLFTKIKRKTELVVIGAVIPSVNELLEHFSPKLAWPPLANVTYILHDWWFPHSKLPTDLPIPLPAGRFKGIGTVLYPNDTKLIIAEAIIEIFHSYENFDY